ncbi:glutamine amidotransferase-related protein [Caulobacter sp. KR2-114]|uniref:glutamine amidotransferase-related protein n=1 Tax=Caulobacter sp. KR2-114 TaxID=3400912 RepID=UPI003C098B2C
MKIGILAAGRPPSALIPEFGDYPSMFRSLLAAGGHDWATYDVQAGGYPGALAECEAYIVTGSSSGVYDPDPWIGELRGFLRAARGQVPLVGVCFGHQIIADAFGGVVIKSPKGWGIGLHHHALRQGAAWLDDVPDYALAASHQDQVVEAPPGATVLAGSDFCPFGMLDYAGDRAMSLQLHPEFDPGYAGALIEGRRGVRFPEAQADAAIDSLKAPNDNARVARWIEAFLARA